MVIPLSTFRSMKQQPFALLLVVLLVLQLLHRGQQRVSSYPLIPVVPSRHHARYRRTIPPRTTTTTPSPPPVACCESSKRDFDGGMRNEDISSSNNDGGYKFGDLTRGALNKFKTKVNDLTGKQDYKFGDLTRWVDVQAKDKVAAFTGKTSGYEFGDITKELLRRLNDGEYSRDDLLLLLKIVATVGINWTPMARILPLKVLIEMLNLSVEVTVVQTVSEKVVSAITNEIDARMKEMVTGDRNYKVGDYTKRQIAKWAGKDSYEFGDITKTVISKIRNPTKQQQGQTNKNGNTEAETVIYPEGDMTTATTTDQILKMTDSELEMMIKWDEEFRAYERQKEGLADLIQDEEYRDWDERFLQGDDIIGETLGDMRPKKK